MKVAQGHEHEEPQEQGVGQEGRHHSYSLVGRVGKGNFGEALLVESSLDGRRYIMKVPLGLYSASAWKTEAVSPSSKS